MQEHTTSKSMFNKVIIHPSYEETIKALHAESIDVPNISSEFDIDYSHFMFPADGELVTPLENISKVDMNAKNGRIQCINGRPYLGYDESIRKYAAMEGTAYNTCHALVLANLEEYLPVTWITLYFYTRSEALSIKSEYIVQTDDPELQSKKDIMRDKLQFLIQRAPPSCLLLIDGPLIGGDVYTYMIHALHGFEEKGIIPLFFVKNSNSNLVVQNISKLSKFYNSDMHWSYRFLRPGQRTSFFQYADKVNRKNAKVFCYFKAFNSAPQRIEMHVDTYNKYQNEITHILDQVYYLILSQGPSNPQLRPIAIAESYARSCISMFNINKKLEQIGLMPTMNQERFG